MDGTSTKDLIKDLAYKGINGFGIGIKGKYKIPRKFVKKSTNSEKLGKTLQKIIDGGSMAKDKLQETIGKLATELARLYILS